jgi:homoserine kinase
MSKRSQQAVRVFAPATVANVAVGYDILGFAIDQPGDEIIARFGTTPGVMITKIHGTKKVLPRDPEKNTATKGVLAMLKHIGEESTAIEIEIYKKMPFASGMGSSAASAAAGVMAVNELLGRPLQKRELARFAVIGESAADGAIHGDNVIPSLVGGIVLIRDNATCDFIKLPAPRGVSVFVIYPEIEILTKDARAVLNKDVPLSKLISQTGNVASFVASLYTSDLALMKRSLKDHVIEAQRAQLIPHFHELQEIALNGGAMNYTISGAGPSMFGFAQNTLIAENVSRDIRNHLFANGVRSQQFISYINVKGAYKM